MDGTLVNSEPLHLQAWKQALAQHRLYYAEEWYHQWVGISDVEMSQRIVAENRLNLSPGEFLADKRELFRVLADSELQPFEGVAEGLTQFGSLKMAVATSSSRQDALASLQKTGLDVFFTSVITADDVTHFKPHPEPYLQASKGLGVAASACVAIEDSKPGLQSAKGAEMFTIGVSNGQETHHLSPADKVFDTTAEAINFLVQQTHENNG